MKKIITILVFLILHCFKVDAQYLYELGVYAGPNKFFGDAKSSNIFIPEGYSVSIFGSKKLSSRYSVKASLDYSRISTKRNKEDLVTRDNTVVQFHNSLMGVSGFLEFNFFNWSFLRGTSHTPYVFLGLSFLLYNQVYTNLIFESSLPSSPPKEVPGQLQIAYAAAIPFGVGYKLMLDQRWTIGMQVNFNYSLTDNLDSNNLPYSTYENNVIKRVKSVSSTVVKNEIEKRRKIDNYGDTNNNDWFVSLGFTVSYAIIETPCPCGQEPR